MSAVIKKILLFALALQFYIILAINNSLFSIPIVVVFYGVTIFSTVLIINTELIEFFKSRSNETLFYMNTTLFAFCLLNKDGIYNTLVKDSINKLSNEINKK